jgi:hypothetical protein
MVMPIGTSTKPKNSGAITPLVSRTALSKRPHNVLERRSKRAAPKAKSELQEVFMAETRQEAYAAFDRFIHIYQVKYPKG